jgi:hypothetical protein
MLTILPTTPPRLSFSAWQPENAPVQSLQLSVRVVAPRDFRTLARTRYLGRTTRPPHRHVKRQDPRAMCAPVAVAAAPLVVERPALRTHPSRRRRRVPRARPPRRRHAAAAPMAHLPYRGWRRHRHSSMRPPQESQRRPLVEASAPRVVLGARVASLPRQPRRTPGEEAR